MGQPRTRTSYAQNARGSTDALGSNPCRCCGKHVWWSDTPIHTRCIPKHWGKHAKGVNASRCQEFNYQPSPNDCALGKCECKVN